MAAENERYERDNNLTTLSGTTSFSHLLFADDDSLGDFDMSQIFKCTSSSNYDKKPRMLCFGDYPNRAESILFSETTKTFQKSSLTCSDSSSSASSANSVLTTMSKSTSNRKRTVSGQEPVQCMNTKPRSSKKTKTENPISNAPPKRKEKLGEKIAALQQLVSPFGKTDAASVLHEAMGYIRFLQEQVQVLCSPYLHRHRSSSSSLVDKEGGENGEKLKGKKDLRSRGLCLVPVECTVHVANTNGADLWSPVMASNVSSSTKQ